MIYIKTYDPPEYDLQEIFRYSGGGEELRDMVLDCIGEAEKVLSYKVCYCELPVEISGDYVKTPAFAVKSSALAKNLSGCKKALIFGATVGIGIDRFITKYGSISPSRAVLCQALGAERIEALCNAFCEDMKAIYGALRPRFSPGYGDFDISMQKEFFSYLDLSRKIGLTLNESLLMSPSKSVTAIMGIGECTGKNNTGCSTCTQRDCKFAKKGNLK